jgi:NitT/TauT family transport system permease protein
MVTDRQTMSPRLRLATIWLLRLVLLAAVYLGALWLSKSTFTTLMPSPNLILRRLWQLIQSGQLFHNAWSSLSLVLISMLIGSTFGIGLALLLRPSPRLKAVAVPLMSALLSVPWIFLYPVMLLIFGVNNWPIIVIASIHVFPPVTLTTLVGFEEVPRIFYKVSSAYHLTPGARAFQVTMPFAFGYMLTGMEIGLIYGFTSVIGMQFLNSTSGLGFQISQDYNLFRTADMYAYVLAIIALAFIFNFIRERVQPAWRR